MASTIGSVNSSSATNPFDMKTLAKELNSSWQEVQYDPVIFKDFVTTCKKKALYTLDETTGFDPLQAAASKGFVGVVKLLLERESFFNFKRESVFISNIQAAFELAIAGKHDEVILLLLDHGNYVTSQTDLQYIIQLYKTKNIDINKCNRKGDNLLHSASRIGSLSQVQALLHAGANPRETTNDTISDKSIHIAAGKGHIPIVKLFIEQYHLDEDELNDSRWCNTPLHAASKMGQIEMAQFLLDHGADVNARNCLGESALHYAADYKWKEVISILLEAGADKSLVARRETALDIARRNNYRKIVAMLDAHPVQPKPRIWQAAAWHPTLFKAFATSHSKWELETIDEKTGFTALQTAANKGYVDVVQRLLDRGVDITTAALREILALYKAQNIDINRCDKGGYNLLHTASKTGKLDQVQLLLQSDADPKVTTKVGSLRYQPLKSIHIAAIYGYTSIVQLFIDNYGLAVDEYNNDTMRITPLHFASSWGNAGVVKCLLERGADANSKTQDGATPLYYAVTQNCITIVPTLLAAGADKTAAVLGKTVCEHAEAEGNTLIGIMLDVHSVVERVLNTISPKQQARATPAATGTVYVSDVNIPLEPIYIDHASQIGEVT